MSDTWSPGTVGGADALYMRRRSTEAQMIIRPVLAGIILLGFTALPAHSQDRGACPGNCVKAWNSCISQCGVTTATLPQSPVSHDRLTEINACVNSQCRPSLGSCQADCRKKPGG